MNPPWYLTEPLQAGAKFASLTVLAELPRKSMNRSYAVQCDCGEESVAWHSGLVQGRTKSCPACTIRRLQQSRKSAAPTWTPTDVGRIVGVSDRTAERWIHKDEAFKAAFVFNGNLRRPRRITTAQPLAAWALSTTYLSPEQRQRLFKALNRTAPTTLEEL